MAFLDEIGRALGQAGQTTMQKTKNITDTARLGNQIAEEEKKINDLYFQIGKRYVSLHMQDYEESFSMMFQAIGKAQEKIRVYRQQIRDIKGVQQCEKCGADVPIQASFCPGCGAGMPKIEITENKQIGKCPSCGKVLAGNTRFCTRCGQALDHFMMPKEPILHDSGSFLENQTKNVQEDGGIGEAGEKGIENPRFCTQCRAVLDEGAVFCTECGAKV